MEFIFGGYSQLYLRFCAGLVVNPATYIKELLSLVVGVIIDFTIAAVFGCGMYLALWETGIDHWFLKRLLFGTIVFLTCYGVLRPLFSIKIESPSFLVLMYRAPNWIYAIITCWFLKKYWAFKV